MNQEAGTHQTLSAGTLMDFPASTIARNTFLLFKPPNLCYLVATRAKTSSKQSCATNEVKSPRCSEMTQTSRTLAKHYGTNISLSEHQGIYLLTKENVLKQELPRSARPSSLWWWWENPDNCHAVSCGCTS